MLTAQRDRTPVFHLLVSLPATAMGFALSVQISVLSWMLATRYGLKIDEIGLVWAAGPLAGILGQVLVGGLSDRTWVWGGRRRGFIIAGGALAALAMLLLPEIGAIAHGLGLAGVFGIAITVALALDLAVNVGFNPTRALIADVTREGAERTRAYSWMQVVSGSFGVGAYAIGAIFGNYVLIYVAVALVLLFGVVPALLIVEPRPAPTPTAAVARGTARSVWAILWTLSPIWALLVYDLYGLGARVLGGATTGFAAECRLRGWRPLGLVLPAPFVGRSDRRQQPSAGWSRRVRSAGLGYPANLCLYGRFSASSRMPYARCRRTWGRPPAFAFLALNACRRYWRRSMLGMVCARALGDAAGPCGRRRHLWQRDLVWRSGWSPRTPWQLYALMALCGIGWGSIVSLPFAILSDRVAILARMGLFMGLFNLSVVLPQLVTSLGVGTLRSRSAAGQRAWSSACRACFWLYLQPCCGTCTRALHTRPVREQTNDPPADLPCHARFALLPHPGVAAQASALRSRPHRCSGFCRRWIWATKPWSITSSSAAFATATATAMEISTGHHSRACLICRALGVTAILLTPLYPSRVYHNYFATDFRWHRSPHTARWRIFGGW